MNAVTKYQSDSGVLFNTQEEAEREDYYYKECKFLADQLPDNKDISNGNGYYKVSNILTEKLTKRFLHLANKFFGWVYFSWRL